MVVFTLVPGAHMSAPSALMSPHSYNSPPHVPMRSAIAASNRINVAQASIEAELYHAALDHDAERVTALLVDIHALDQQLNQPALVALGAGIPETQSLHALQTEARALITGRALVGELYTPPARGKREDALEAIEQMARELHRTRAHLEEATDTVARLQDEQVAMVQEQNRLLARIILDLDKLDIDPARGLLADATRDEAARYGYSIAIDAARRLITGVLVERASEDLDALVAKPYQSYDEALERLGYSDILPHTVLDMGRLLLIARSQLDVLIAHATIGELALLEVASDDAARDDALAINIMVLTALARVAPAGDTADAVWYADGKYGAPLPFGRPDVAFDSALATSGSVRVLRTTIETRVRAAIGLILTYVTRGPFALTGGVDRYTILTIHYGELSAAITSIITAIRTMDRENVLTKTDYATMYAPLVTRLEDIAQLHMVQDDVDTLVTFATEALVRAITGTLRSAYVDPGDSPAIWLPMATGLVNLYDLRHIGRIDTDGTSYLVSMIKSDATSTALFFPNTTGTPTPAAPPSATHALKHGLAHKYIATNAFDAIRLLALMVQAADWNTPEVRALLGEVITRANPTDQQIIDVVTPIALELFADEGATLATSTALRQYGEVSELALQVRIRLYGFIQTDENDEKYYPLEQCNKDTSIARYIGHSAEITSYKLGEFGIAEPVKFVTLPPAAPVDEFGGVPPVAVIEKTQVDDLADWGEF